MKIRIGLITILLLGMGSLTAHAIADPFTMSWDQKTRQLNPGAELQVDVFMQIPPGHYLYADRTKLRLLGDQPFDLVDTTYSASQRKHDRFSGEELPVYIGPALASIRVKAPELLADGQYPLMLDMIYQGCSPKICFREQRKQIKLVVQVGEGSTSAQVMTKPTAASGSWLQQLTQKMKRALETQGWLAYLLAFIGGLLTDFTPCVLPLIPLTLAVLGVREDSSAAKNSLLTSVLVIAMASTYAVFGVTAALLGLQLGFLFQNPWFLLGSALLFLIFALGMFGVYEFQVPSFLRQRMARWGGQGYSGAAIAGVTMGLLAAPCVGPVIGALLLWVAQTRDAVHGFTLLFVFGLGMGSLIWVLGTFFGKFVGRVRSGPATRWVKWVMGLLLLLPAAYYGYIAYQGFKPALVVPVVQQGDFKWYKDFDTATAAAQQNNKPILIDFFAEWCLPCLEWDEVSFSKPEVQSYLQAHYIALKIDCTQNTPACQAAVKRYQTIGWPTILITDSTGHAKKGSFLVGEVLRPKAFIRYLKQWHK